jgi:hypothetical protein
MSDKSLGFREFMLEAYQGGRKSNDRVTDGRSHVARYLTIGLLGGAQPKKFKAMIDSDPDDGFLARMLFAWPASAPEFKMRAPDPTQDIEFATRAMDYLRRLDMARDEYGPAYSTIRLSDAAYEDAETFVGRCLSYGAAAGGFVEQMGVKARGQAMRLSVVLELLKWAAACAADTTPPDPTTFDAFGQGFPLPVPQEVTHETFRDACRLFYEYYLPTARAVFAHRTESAPKVDARTLLTWLRRKQPKTVALRDIVRAGLSGLDDTEAARRAADVLVDVGLLRPRQGTQKGKVTQYDVHPNLPEPPPAMN